MRYEVKYAANISHGKPSPDDDKHASDAAGAVIKFLGGDDSHKTRRNWIFRGPLSAAGAATMLSLLYAVYALAVPK